LSKCFQTSEPSFSHLGNSNLSHLPYKVPINIQSELYVKYFRKNSTGYGYMLMNEKLHLDNIQILH
jgi:hypothetical protein